MNKENKLSNDVGYIMTIIIWTLCLWFMLLVTVKLWFCTNIQNFMH